MPPHDVTVAGAPYVSAGSTSAYCARMNGAAIPVFVWVFSSAITMPPETSEPDPAVVGIATSGSAGAEAARSRSAATVRYGTPGAQRQARGLGEVDHRAAADRDHDVGFRRGEGLAEGIGLPDVGSPGAFTCVVTSTRSRASDASASATPGRSPATGSRIT